MFKYLIEQDLSNEEQNFLKKLKNNEFKNPYKFILINEIIEKEIIYSCFEGLLDYILCYHLKENTLVLHKSKQEYYLNDIVDLLSDDLGSKVSLFNGFEINKNNFEKFDLIIEKVKLVLTKKRGVIDSKDLVLDIIKNDRVFIKELREIIFYKYKDDFQFKTIINGLFQNNLNVSKTAKDIYMHRNTINNKIEAVYKDTNFNISKFIDALCIYEIFN